MANDGNETSDQHSNRLRTDGVAVGEWPECLNPAIRSDCCGMRFYLRIFVLFGRVTVLDNIVGYYKIHAVHTQQKPAEPRIVVL